jgi:MoxR-like ATPase
MSNIDKLNEVLKFVKTSFIGKDEIVDLLGISLIGRENAFLLGPPGTAKSAIVRLLSQCIEDGKNFEYLLTRFTEPNEIFGPFDIRKLKDGELVTNTDGMMPEASLVFLDEIFNANSAILNSLLMALNEKIFRRGKETRKLPALMFVGASNALPEEESLNALLDRFLIRVKCDYVDPDKLHEVLLAGWGLENKQFAEIPVIGS